MRRAFIPVVGIAGAALVLAVVAGTFAANGDHTPIGSGPGTNGGRGGPAFATAAPATNFDGAAATTIATAPTTIVAGTALTAAQASALQAMAEEEKLALDAYTVLGRTWTRNAFANIARSEANHLSQVRSLLTAYGLSDPTSGLATGSFATPEFTALYAKLVASGQGSQAAAFEAGRTIELDDISRLDAALAPAGLPSDVALVYDSLRSASYTHLATFDRLLGR
jgi:hypothetical protein